jgi:DNA replication ATP-dependent helicase Dna2
MRWSQHVADAQLVAANFAMLCYPGRAEPGEFDYAIADEVSMANIPSLVAASFFAKHGLVLGGDPHQLPPIYPEDAEEPNEYFRDNVFQKAGVEDPNDARAAFLDTQYRMQKEIGDLVSRMFYGGVLKTATRRCSGAAACGTRVAFIHSPGAVKTRRVSQADTDDDARFNDVHAESAASAVALLLAKGVGPADVGVIAPYNAQVVQIHRRVREASDVYGVRTDGVKVSTVHRFQGQERRAMVVDFTDDNVKPTRLTSNRHLVNVALSRAKEQLVIIGNSEYLVSTEYFSADKVDMFKQLLEGCQILEWPQ